MKIPLLASSLAQNSAWIMKSLYLFLVTRWEESLLASLSATTAPSSSRQLLSPTRSQSPILLASSSVTQPSPLWPEAGGAA